MKNYNVNTFLEKLSSLNWLSVINFDNVDMSWEAFSEMFLNVIDSVAPLKKVRLKQDCEPWFSGEILELISRRDKAWIKFRKYNDEISFSDYKSIRNKCQNVIRKAKKDFVKNEISESQNSPKALWKTLKKLGMPSKGKGASTNIGLKNDSDEISFDSNFVVNKFNDFFCNVASNLVKKLPKRDFNTVKVDKFYKDKGITPNDFNFTVVSEGEVEKLLKNLNVTKSTGCDNISAKFLKDAAGVISTPLTHIINLSLQTSTVPSLFKKARVVPLFKKGDRNKEGNYRPVSILPVISKILERIVFNQLHGYLNKNNLIFEFQSGFRPCFSTDTALSFLSDKIRFNMDNGLYTGIVLIDLQKAFDRVDHKILLSKLSLQFSLYYVVFHKVQYWGHCYLISM